MVEFRFNVEEAAREFGTEAIQKNYEKIKGNSKKKKGNLDGRDTKAVIREMNLLYEEIEVVGRGANRIFVCKKKREKMLEKKELQNYSNCGKGQIIYEDSLEELILMYLTYGNRYHKITTLRRLAYECGAITKELYEFSRLFGHEEKREYFKKYVDAEKYDECDFDLLYEVAGKEVERIIKNIKTVLGNLKERELIIYNQLTHGVVEGKKNEEDTHEVLDIMAVIEIKNKQQALREEHALSMGEVLFASKNTRVKEYKKKEWEYLQLLGYKRIYNTNHIELINWDKKIADPSIEWNKSKEVFRIKFISNSFHKAAERNDAFFNKPARVKPPLKMLGGKPKPKGIWMATEYDNTFGSNALQTNYISQLKFSKIYSSEYTRILSKLLGGIG